MTLLHYIHTLIIYPLNQLIKWLTENDVEEYLEIEEDQQGTLTYPDVESEQEKGEPNEPGDITTHEAV